MVLKTRFELRVQSSTKAHSWPACADWTSKSSSISLGSRCWEKLLLVTLQELIETPQERFGSAARGKYMPENETCASREDDRSPEKQRCEQLLANGYLR